jgi:hypothetical protein
MVVVDESEEEICAMLKKTKKSELGESSGFETLYACGCEDGAPS